MAEYTKEQMISDATSLPAKSTFLPHRIPSPTKVYTSNTGRGSANTLRWESPQWDLAEINRIIDTESYVRRAFRNKKNLFLKEGYDFTSNTPVRTRYIESRFEQISNASDIPLCTLMTSVVSSLIRLSNSFVVKVRNNKASGGKIRVNSEGKTLQPVAGYFLLPAETVQVKRDSYGKIKKYQQVIWGKPNKEFNPEDVIHFYFDRREGESIGTPVLVPVKDDIRALRRIEENVELLVEQHLFPLFHYKVGTEERPAGVNPDGVDEVTEAKLQVAAMPADGCWVTPENHSIIAVDAKGSVPAIDRIIEHFKQRIFTGLGVSSVDMGEGGTSNRSTADTMSRNLVDDTKTDQNEFAGQFKDSIIKELLLESTFDQDTLFEEEFKVDLRFSEIDLEAKMSKENHFTDLFEKNAITHPELRIELGRKPFEGEGWATTKKDGDWNQTNYALIKRDEIILQSLDEPGTAASKSESKSRTTQNKSGENKAVANKNKPQNQHGTRTSAKLKRDVYLDSSIAPLISRDMPLQRKYSMLKEDILNALTYRNGGINEIRVLINVAFSDAEGSLVSEAQQAYRLGYTDNSPRGTLPPFSVDQKIQFHVSHYVRKLKKDLLSFFESNIIQLKVFKKDNVLIAKSVMDSLTHRVYQIDESEIIRAYNYGTALAIQDNNNNVSIQVEDNACDVCKSTTLEYTVSDAIIYEEIPPFHPHCKCRPKRGVL